MVNKLPMIILSFWLIGFGGYFLMIEMTQPAKAQRRPPIQTNTGGYLNFPGGRPSFTDVYSVLYLDSSRFTSFMRLEIR